MAKKKYGQWQIESSLGEGGQGFTFRVTNENGARGVLKRLKNPTRGWRFKREIEAFQRISSPNIPCYIDSGMQGEQNWVVVEDCGESMPNVLAEGTSLEVILSWYADITKAVFEAHKLGIIHRDIKPNNIVIDQENNSAYLIDFGICYILNDAPPWTTSEEAFGNAAFAAPECLLGTTEPPGAPCDIYSMGKLFYWMISNRRHILRERLEGLEDHVRHENRHVRARLFSLVRKTVLENPLSRFSAEELTNQAALMAKYLRDLSQEKSSGVIRLVDNLGENGNFNTSSSRSIVSQDFTRSNLHPNIAMVGEPTSNMAQAELYNNPYSHPVTITTIQLGLSCYSYKGGIDVVVVADENNTPSGHVLGVTSVELGFSQPTLISINLSCSISPGHFWVALKPNNTSNSYVSICTGSDEVSPQTITFAESFNGGENWVVKNSLRGPGLAIRVYGEINTDK
jgi:serine/threonine protein kinase